jgi:hypothetical protein
VVVIVLVLHVAVLGTFQATAAGVWEQQAQIANHQTPFGSDHGRSLAVELNTLVVQSSAGSFGVGRFQTLDRASDGSWAPGSDLPVVGSSVDMDGDLVAVGDPRDAVVAVYVLVKDNAGGWTTLATLRGDDTVSGDKFGYQVAVAGNYVAVGAPGEDDAAPDAGAVYVFHRDGSGFAQTAKLTAPDGAEGDGFGSAVAATMSGRVVIGAPLHDEDTYSADPLLLADMGAAYVSDLDLNGNRNPITKIVAPEEIVSTHENRPTQFGWSVAATELGLVAVGVPFTAQSNQVHVYEENGGNWALHSLLAPTQLADRPSFGQTLDWEGELLAVGAPRSNSAGFVSGTAYVYELDPGTLGWNETFDSTTGTWAGTEIQPTGLNSHDDSGTDVAVDRETAVVGVPDYDAGSANSGAAFVFVPADWTYPSDVDIQGPPGPAMGAGPNPAGTFQSVALTARANDSTTGGSVIAAIEYQVDSGSWAFMESLDAGFDTVEETGIATVSFATEGAHQACARGIDDSGNVGEVSCIDIEVVGGDQAAPQVMLTLDPNPVDRFESTSIEVSADDTGTGGSWVVFTEYRIDGGAWQGILSPEDGSYDSPTEKGITEASFSTVGGREICARATDAANNTSDPVCELLNVGDVVPLTITFTRIELLGTSLDDGDTADLYGRVSFLIPGSEIELSNPDEAVTLGINETDSPYWNFPLSVPATEDPLTVGIALADRDPGEVGDLADISGDGVSPGVTIDVDLSRGTWTGGPLAQECFTGAGEDAASVCVAVSVRSSNADQDGDGIHDAFELYGYDHDGDGSADVDFPALGANVCRPDIAVEIDWMKDHDPLAVSIAAVRDAFADAPIPAHPTCVDDAGNPAAPGINLIVDMDEEIPTERAIDCDRIGEMNDEYLAEARKPFFLWNGWVRDIFEEGDTTSGVACGSGGFVASLGNYDYGNTFGSESNFGVMYGAAEDQLRIEAGTFMHELGHKLALGHGGADSINYKPNHLSVMSYAFQFFWLLQASDTSGTPAGTLDYSLGMPALDEDALTETTMDPNTDILTLWDDPNDDAKAWLVAPVDQPLDWNDNGSIGGPSITISQDLNRDGVRTCVSAGADETLDTLLLLGTDDEVDDSGDISRITVGPDGICATPAFAGDRQSLPIGFDSRLLRSDNEWELIRYPALSKTFGAGSGAGAEIEEHRDADPSDPDFAAVLEAWAGVVDATPVAEVAVATQVAQYSDGINPVTLTVTDPDSTLTTASVSGAPDSVGLTADGCETFDNGLDDDADGSVCTWTLAGVVKVPVGTYEVTFTVSDGSSEAVTKTQIIVEVEDAAIGFGDSPTTVEVAEPGGDSGPFSLQIEVSEFRPDTPSETAAPGDITKLATTDVAVSLAPVGPGSSIAVFCVADPIVDDGYAKILSLTCDLDGVPVNTYSIDVVVSGDYYAGTGEDVLTVFDPSLGFTTGGGWFPWPESGDKTTFGFTISYNKKGINAKGSLLLVRHLDDGTSYRVKSNAVEALSVGEGADFTWASFVTKTTYKDPNMEEPEGNYEISVYVEDRVLGDRLWIQVRDKNGVAIEEISIVSPATTESVEIASGSILVPHETRGRPSPS